MENKVLASVNGRKITELDIQQAISRFPADRQQYLNTDEGKKQLLNQIISYELVYYDAKDSGLENDEEYINQVEIMKREMLTQIGIKKALDSVYLTEEEGKAYYEANKKAFEVPQTVSAKHILVDSEEKAIQIKEEIAAGKSFEEAAQEYSSCPSKAQGGDLGSFSRGQMVPEFEEAAFAQEIGVVGEPVKTQFGFHLVKVENKSEAECKPFDEVKQVIVDRLIQERQNMRYMQYTEELKNKYTVEIF